MIRQCTLSVILVEVEKDKSSNDMIHLLTEGNYNYQTKNVVVAAADIPLSLLPAAQHYPYLSLTANSDSGGNGAITLSL